MDGYDYVLKILICGEALVGKTCLLNKYCLDKYPENYASTIGVDFQIKTVDLDNGTKLKLQLWDTAGQERFYSIVKSYFRGAHIALLCYDVTNFLSFKKLPKWIEDIKKFAREHTQIVVVGTKIDDEYYRIIDRKLAEEFAKNHGADYAEISSKLMDHDELHKIMLNNVLTRMTDLPELYGLVDFKVHVEKEITKQDCCTIL